MSDPVLVPQRPMRSILLVWAFALVAGVGINVFVPGSEVSLWMTMALAATLIVSFVVQLVGGTVHRFIQRVALGAVGGAVVLGLVGLVGAVTRLLASPLGA